MNRNKYVCNFWITVFYFALSAVLLYIWMLIMIICHKRWQLQKNKKVILQKEKYV